MRNMWIWLAVIAAGMGVSGVKGGQAVNIENDDFSIGVDAGNGAIISFVIKKMNCELIGEKRLAANFRICLPLKDYLCNYIEGTEQKANVSKEDNIITVRYSGMQSAKGKFPIDLSYTIRLDGDQVRFKSKLTNKSKEPVSEFWFPRLGGWTNFGGDANAVLQMPSYTSCETHGLFKQFPQAPWMLGAEAPESWWSYPGKPMSMPWHEIHGANNTGLYMGYHDEVFRYSTWHYFLYPCISGRENAWLTKEEARGEPVGLVFSHVRYPFIANGETLESGEFIFRVHGGDWHQGSGLYRKWFTERWPMDKSDRWLRKKSSWFTAIAYQPEDKLVADYNLYGQWCRDAQDKAGISCFELCGWHKGGIEREYPDYVPEEKLGGTEGFRKLMRDIDSRGGKFLAFVNYNILDENTEWYKKELHKYTHQDQFGTTPNALAWGESTLLARTSASVRRHLTGSVVEPLEKILENRYVLLAKNGAHGVQIDKLINSRAPSLDFNPLNKFKPDTALCQGLVESISRVLSKCREVDPNFCFAGEASQDRLIPYIDVFYRAAGGCDISPLRYVFAQEFTACAHAAWPGDYAAVNGAVLTGAVICAEPDWYMGSFGNAKYDNIGKYIKEVERIRAELVDIIFLGRYYDNIDARVTEVTAGKEGASGGFAAVKADGKLVFRVHGDAKTDKRAIAVTNLSDKSRMYKWQFTKGDVEKAKLYVPFEAVREVSRDVPVEIKPEGLNILVEAD